MNDVTMINENDLINKIMFRAMPGFRCACLASSFGYPCCRQMKAIVLSSNRF